MALTFGAIIILVGLILLIYYGYSVGVKKHVKPGEENLQRCSLCLRSFPRDKLIERQVGDSKVLCFCEGCVRDLHKEIESRLTAG